MIAKRQTVLTPVIGVISAILFLISSPACWALTAKDVTEKMSKDERSGYLSGLIDMRATVAALSGDPNLPRCIHEAFYGKSGADNDGWAKLYDAFAQFPDNEASTIIFLIVKKTCGS